MDYSVEEMAFISSYNIGEFMAPQGEESGSEAPATEVEGQRRRKDVGDDEERHIPDTHIQPPPENGGSGTGSLRTSTAASTATAGGGATATTTGVTAASTITCATGSPISDPIGSCRQPPPYPTSSPPIHPTPPSLTSVNSATSGSAAYTTTVDLRSDLESGIPVSMVNVKGLARLKKQDPKGSGQGIQKPATAL
ncbi:unnamed protein product, partial [Cuscuta europaea]